MTEIYTDGASSPNGNGGWAWALEGFQTYDSGNATDTTNQRMEMQAAIEGITCNCHLDQITIVSDSAYVVNGMNQRWFDKWQKNNWIASTKKAVKNRDLWEQLIQLTEIVDVTFVHVKGHSGHPGNDFVDELAVIAKKMLNV